MNLINLVNLILIIILFFIIIKIGLTINSIKKTFNDKELNLSSVLNTINDNQNTINDNLKELTDLINQNNNMIFDTRSETEEFLSYDNNANYIDNTINLLKYLNENEDILNEGLKNIKKNTSAFNNIDIDKKNYHLNYGSSNKENVVINKPTRIEPTRIEPTRVGFQNNENTTTDDIKKNIENIRKNLEKRKELKDNLLSLINKISKNENTNKILNEISKKIGSVMLNDLNQIRILQGHSSGSINRNNQQDTKIRELQQQIDELSNN
jgi:hypothetical protein